MFNRKGSNPGFSVLTWNIRQGGGKNCEKIIAYLISHNPDFIVLTEYQNKNGPLFLKVLKAKGYFVFTSSPADKENGILIASKVQFEQDSSAQIFDDKQRWISLYLPSLDLHVLAIHIPGAVDHKFVDGVGSSGKSRKERMWQSIIEYATQHLENKTIIIGDFNTGLKEDAEGTPFVLSKYMKELIKFGYVDAWRKLNGDAKEYTWYSQHKVDGVTRDRNGFRLDYIFASPKCADLIHQCYHSHEERRLKISDHSLLLAEIAR
jgi:exodeoxyribonuclease-3